MNEQDAAALGRMGYSLRCLVSGWRMTGERVDLVMRALANEVINVAGVVAQANMIAARELVDRTIDRAWETVMQQNPKLRPKPGGN